jgi:hypothetical protein
MKKERNTKILVIIALLISVISLSIAYAAYSATLLISGTVTAKKSSSTWNVHFTTTDGGDDLIPTLYGNAKVVSKASLSETTISNFEITFYAPGDSITYDFEVKNTGSVDATLNKITMGSLNCSSIGTTLDGNTEANTLCQNIHMNITKKNGETINIGDKIPSGGYATYKLTITWDKNDSSNYSNDIAINVGTTTFDFIQN